jgi:hypothetical protein
MLNDQQKNSPKKPLNNYVRFSAMGLQMAAIMLLLTWIGIKLDSYFNLKFPIFTLVLACFSVVASLWYFIREFLPKK